jgi:hypothetical protein
MIQAALDEAGIERSRYSCIAFPSDYANIEKILPKNTVFLMSVTGESDTKKIAYLRSRGFDAATVLSVPDGGRQETSGGVRDRAKRGDDSWNDLVPDSISHYMREHGLLERLAILSPDNPVE